MTDVQKALQALRIAGKRGIHSFELNRIVGTFRSAARINDLKKLGYKITSIPEVRGNALGCRYFLDEKSASIDSGLAGKWDFTTGKAIWMIPEEPKQEHLF